MFCVLSRRTDASAGLESLQFGPRAAADLVSRRRRRRRSAGASQAGRLSSSGRGRGPVSASARATAVEARYR